MFAKILNLLTLFFQYLKNTTPYPAPTQQAQVMVPLQELTDLIESQNQATAYLYELTTTKRLTDQEYRTLILIHLLAIRHDYRLPPLHIFTLAQTRKVSLRTIERHLSYLQKSGLIRVTPLDEGEIDLVIFDRKFVILNTHEHAVVNNCIVDSYNNSVLNNDNNLLEQQHVQHVTRDKIVELQRRLSQVFVDNGEAPYKALKFAAKLIALHGYQICLDQLTYLPQRCENFKNSPGGLRTTPAGVLVASIKANWSPPAASQENQEAKSWYTDDEFNELFQT